MALKPSEARIMAHRYLYYVLNKPVISDREYDQLEKRALETCSANSIIKEPGSDRHEDYPQEAIDLAGWFIEDRNQA